MALEVSWNRAPRVLIATLTGRIDSANSMDCHKALTAGIGPDDHALVLNMAGVRFLSSAGLRVLLMLAKKFTGPGKAFAVCELTDNINEVMSVSGFAEIIQVRPSQHAAVAAVTGEDGSDADSAGETPDPSADSPDLRNPIDMNVVGENIADLANFTIEKHEFVNGPLAGDVRSEAFKAISDLLWGEIEQALERRKRIIARMFQEAGATLQEVVAKHAG
uniref:Anti-sigma factor antagonist n=1 Tax=bacterium symbiont of Plakortis simplex pPS11G3 TaxID=1256902 RepID=V5JAJ3_UNCXX|nr:anti-anti-sigma regulatory factor/hypothetical protein [bacterium symbiont of Plakortis simplex pPS11G3]